MNRHERLTALLELIVERDNVHIDDIVTELAVSAATARRDLDHLAQQQLITRTRGGATPSPTSSDLPLRYKMTRQPVEKRRIAEAGAQLVVSGEVVGLNGGTTTTELARELVMRSDLHEEDTTSQVVVVTNAVNIANELAVRRHVRVVLTGGVVRAMSFELAGPLAMGIFDDITIDTLFLGVNAIGAEGAFSDHDDEAAINAALVEHAKRTIVVADHTKVGATAFAKICPPEAIDILITDDAAEPDVLAALTRAGIDITTVAGQAPLDSSA